MNHHACYAMPFGKYKGKPIRQVPSDYLVWMKQFVDMREPLKTNVEKELEYRDNEQPECWDDGDDDNHDHFRQVTQSDVATWYRKMATEFHPDRRGGSKEGMKAINRGKELLEEILRKR